MDLIDNGIAFEIFDKRALLSEKARRPGGAGIWRKQPSRPTARARAHYVELDYIVLGRDGGIFGNSESFSNFAVPVILARRLRMI